MLKIDIFILNFTLSSLFLSFYAIKLQSRSNIFRLLFSYKIIQIDIQPVFKCNFCSFLAKITLKLNSCMFLLDFCCMVVPMLVFAAWLVQEPYESEFPNLLRLSPNFSPNFSPNQTHLSLNFHCFHNKWGLLLR